MYLNSHTFRIFKIYYYVSPLVSAFAETTLSGAQHKEVKQIKKYNQEYLKIKQTSIFHVTGVIKLNWYITKTH